MYRIDDPKKIEPPGNWGPGTVHAFVVAEVIRDAGPADWSLGRYLPGDLAGLPFGYVGLARHRGHETEWFLELYARRVELSAGDPNIRIYAPGDTPSSIASTLRFEARWALLISAADFALIEPELFDSPGGPPGHGCLVIRVADTVATSRP